MVRAAERTVTGRALACLVAGDRHHQATTEIIPMLSDGLTVLCDRYVESSLVLQRYDGVDTDYILAINSGIPRPTMRIRLQAEPAILTRRLAEREVLPERRFEHGIGAISELKLYEEADQLLLHREQLDAHIFDTSTTDVAELGSVVAELILSRR
jgi:dTMP kinase